MKKINAFMDFLTTYGWAILVVLVVIGALAYYGIIRTPEEFNPELHNCVEWDSYFIKVNQTSSEGYPIYVPSNCDELYSKNGILKAWNCPNDNCVSWQPKIPQLNKEEQQIVMENYCQNNPSDYDKCECIEERKSSHRVADWSIFCIAKELNQSVNVTLSSEHFFIPFPESNDNWLCQMPQLEKIREENKTICVKALPKSEAIN